MTALLRYSRPVDGTIPVSALLYEDERLLASQDGVGLYDGPNKSASHQSGSIHITSHRLLFISGAPSSSPNYAPPPTSERGASLALDLEAVAHTESYTGFFTSSPKVTLHLRALEHHSEREARKNFPESAPTLSVSDATVHANETSSAVLDGPSGSKAVSPLALAAPFDNPFDLWECEICGYRNPPGLSPAARNACGLCGMPRTLSSSTTPSSSTPRPTSSLSTNFSSPTPLPVPISSSRSALSPGPAYLHSRSLPSSKATTPAPLSMSPTSQGDTFTSRGEYGGGLEKQDTKRRKRRPSALACPACTFLNHPSLQECEICGKSLLSTEQEETQTLVQIPNLQPPHLPSKSAPTSRPVSPVFDLDYNKSSTADVDERERYIKLSFRKGGDKAFYAALKTALQQKEWEVRNAKQKKGGSGPEASSGTSGISGILQTMNSTAQHTERGMSDAFADLEALMSKAQDMVRLAKGLNEQLAAAARSPSDDGEPLEPEEATFVRSSLGQLGLGMKNTAVTSDMSGDERKYLEQLAIELAGVLESNMDTDAKDRRGEKVGIIRRKGIVGLDEVWGGWNRARGVALISPETTLKVLPYLPLHTTPPITTRTLASGLRVLHTPAYAPSAFAARLVTLLINTGICTTTTIASSEMLSVGLTDELVGEVEERGSICRDDPRAGINGGAGMGVDVRWWVNAFNGYVWDGQSG